MDESRHHAYNYLSSSSYTSYTDELGGRTMVLPLLKALSCENILALKTTLKATKGSPHENVGTSIWALPVWGGGLDPCQDGFGHLFREELSKFKWAFA